MAYRNPFTFLQRSQHDAPGDYFVRFQSTSDYSVHVGHDGEIKPFNDQTNQPYHKRKRNTFLETVSQMMVGSQELSAKPQNTGRDTQRKVVKPLPFLAPVLPMPKRQKRAHTKGGKGYSEADVEKKLIPKPFEDREKDNEIPKMPMGEAVGQHPFRALFSGASATGKSTLWGFLVKEHFSKYFHKIYVMAKTVKLDPIYKQLIDEGCIEERNTRDFFDRNLLDEIKEEQIRAIEAAGGKAGAPRVYVDVNDLADDTKAMNDSGINDYFFSCRHYNISISVQTQKYNRVHLRNRTNCTNLFIFSPSTFREAESVCHENAHTILGPTKKDAEKAFYEILRTATEDPENPYSFLHINKQVEDRREMYRKGLKELISFPTASDQAKAKAKKGKKDSANVKDKTGSEGDDFAKSSLPDTTVKSKNVDQNMLTEHLGPERIKATIY